MGGHGRSGDKLGKMKFLAVDTEPIKAEGGIIVSNTTCQVHARRRHVRLQKCSVTVVSTFPVLTHWNLTATQAGRYYYNPILQMKLRPEKASVVCSESHN